MSEVEPPVGPVRKLVCTNLHPNLETVYLMAHGTYMEWKGKL